jgi:hypothetical protein
VIRFQHSHPVRRALLRMLESKDHWHVFVLVRRFRSLLHSCGEAEAADRQTRLNGTEVAFLTSNGGFLAYRGIGPFPGLYSLCRVMCLWESCCISSLRLRVSCAPTRGPLTSRLVARFL